MNVDVAPQSVGVRRAHTGPLVNIDNGGTLTDICVLDGGRVWRTKTLTTPYDLSQCLFDGLRKVSKLMYGEEDLLRLVSSAANIRYSTTQGTNALVERKGPRLGLIHGGGLQLAALRGDGAQAKLFDALVGSRVVAVEVSGDDDAVQDALVRAITGLSSAGANRVVVAFGGGDHVAEEVRAKSLLLRKFPQHLLGALPILYAHELAGDLDDSRRSWTSLFNAFLHPSMERFLYNAEHGLREYRSRAPLLVFRNDGYSARVARTIAVKTYSSGPRGGAEGAKALAAHHGFARLLSIDIGGTTTDIALVERGVARAQRYGQIEGVATAIPLCDVVSVGVGGSSIIRVEGDAIAVGPESVGSAPGPACFGLGGTKATMTDAFLRQGLLDPASYFGGELHLDGERASAAITAAVGGPLGITEDEAVQRMETAWVEKVVASLHAYTTLTPDTVLSAFGGAGPFVACRIAQEAGLSRVIIPGLAAVFSAFGIGFSDIGHTYEAALASNDAGGLEAAREALLRQARHGMFAEGAELGECQLTFILRRDDGASPGPLPGQEIPAGLPQEARLSLELQAVKPIAHAQLSSRFGGATHPADSAAKRRILVDGSRQDVPLYRAEDQTGGATAQGPAVLEEAFFTARIDAGWRFEISEAGDILLSRV